MKGNPKAGRSTAEVESISIDRGTFVHALPLAATLETILGRSVRVICSSDNEASVSAGKKGYSRKLAYLKKYQRTSLAAIREVYVGHKEHEEPGDLSPNVLRHINSTLNRSDLGTKPLDAVRHWTLLNRMRVQSLANTRALL